MTWFNVHLYQLILYKVGTFKEQLKLWETDTDRDMRLVGIEWLLGYEVVDLNAASNHICHTLSTN